MCLPVNANVILLVCRTTKSIAPVTSNSLPLKHICRVAVVDDADAAVVAEDVVAVVVSGAVVVVF